MLGTKRKLLVILLAVLAITLVVWLIVNSNPKLERITVVNVGSQSFSVAWFSQNLSKACVLAVPENKRDQWFWQCEVEKKRTHLVSFEAVKPQSQYSLVLLSGFRLWWQKISPVVTEAISNQAPVQPEPAYGSLVGEEGDLAAGALVLVYPESEEFHYPVAVVANLQGNYAVDLGSWPMEFERLIVEVIGSGGIWNEQTFYSQFINPIPTMKVAL